MSKSLLIPALSFVFLFNSCADNSYQDDDTSATEDNAEMLIESSEPVGDVATEFSQDVNQENGEIDQEQTISAQPAQQSSPSGLKINPAHGEPGHRCDVNVGDPMPDNNSPSGVSVQPSPQQQQIAPAPSSIMTAPVQSTPTQAAPAVGGSTAAGMNPPHGEPGHDCAIPVGSPLTK